MFNIFFVGIERGSLDSSVEKLLLITFSTIKIINFDVNELYLTKKKEFDLMFYFF
jgi:hypothetical protein